MLWLTLGVVAVLAAAIFWLLSSYLRQQAKIFRASDRDLGCPADYGIHYQDVYFGRPAGRRLHGWWIPGDHSPLVLYFHGALGNLSFELPTLQFLHSRGVCVFAIDYPGYGKSAGSPSEKGCLRAAEAACGVAQERGYASEQVVLYGQSLGCALAAHLAGQADYRCVVLQSGFTSIPRMARTRLPQLVVRRFSRVKLDCGRWLSSITSPLLILHGRADRVIPISHGRELFDSVETPKRFVELPGGHTDLEWRQHPQVRDAWAEVISGQARSWSRS